jgi:hypothetical protein
MENVFTLTSYKKYFFVSGIATYELDDGLGGRLKPVPQTV